jgi:hypothetical protein
LEFLASHWMQFCLGQLLWADRPTDAKQVVPVLFSGCPILIHFGEPGSKVTVDSLRQPFLGTRMEEGSARRIFSLSLGMRSFVLLHLPFIPCCGGHGMEDFPCSHWSHLFPTCLIVSLLHTICVPLPVAAFGFFLSHIHF